MHTPGPWELCDAGKTIIVAGGPNSDDLAEFLYSDEHTVSVSREEALANARLFIAAPMMLALLEKLAFLIGATTCERDLVAIRAIIGRTP
jgi:hypothetical protein